MLANYHTHTSRCRHACGKDEDYILNAIAGNLKVLGFSDHAPYIYPDGYISGYKMLPNEGSEYVSSISALREKYRGKIDIKIGLEAEYYPSLWENTLKYWKSLGGIEYLILGQHFTCEEYPRGSAYHSFDGFCEKAPVTEYVNTVTEAIKTGCFTYIAHPDLINYTGTDIDFYRNEMSKMLKEVIRADIPLELNILGLSDGRSYPTAAFWELASKFSPRVILGSDAHSPNHVAAKSNELKALRFADKYKLNLIKTVELVNPFRD